jgi:hypothetical protein
MLPKELDTLIVECDVTSSYKRGKTTEYLRRALAYNSCFSMSILLSHYSSTSKSILLKTELA